MSRFPLSALILSAVLAFAPAQPSAAQDRAALVADSVQVDPSGRLIATGGVEVFYRGARLRATQITYDRAADRLLIEGPITLVDDQGTILVASQADLSADLTEGILHSARLVLNRELQMAAAQIQRIGGRITALDRVVASSCRVCESDPTPLWEIRARRVVHDSEERQIYFTGAQFRVAGVPVAYFPRLRMPDPTLDRATGLLPPSIRTTSGLGTGLRLPYFIAFGPHRDLTITPYFSTKSGRTVELRWRQAFRTGEIELQGALSRDEIRPGETRGRIFATGQFDLPRDYTLSFRGEAVSDPGYLLDYGLEDRDRIDSRVEITRTRRNEYVSGRLIGFKSLRETDVDSTIPSTSADATLIRRFSGGPLGGEAGLTLQFHSHYRPSANPFDGPDVDDLADGRDVSRLTARIDWRRNWHLQGGIIGSLMAEGRLDSFAIGHDGTTTVGTGYTRGHGTLGAELRWPWLRADADGTSHVIEPVVQLLWSPGGTERLPNEDSRLVEFDEGNLFSLNRYPGADAVERGTRMNLGLSYTRTDAAGWVLGATLGKVLRDRDLGQFSTTSGLAGQSSDWLASFSLGLPGGFGVAQRMVIGDSSTLAKSETRVSLQGDGYGISGSYLWIVADLDEDRPAPISELLLNGSYELSDGWTVSGETRYDFEADRAARAGLGLQFRNECVNLDVSVSRRFTSSTSVRPTTDFGLSVDLVGFGSGAAAGPARTCRR